MTGSRAPIVVCMTDVYPRYVGAHEIRDMLGVSRQRVYQLAGQPGFPKPVATLAQGKIWLISDIETWISVHRTASRARRPRTAPAPEPRGPG
jgi:prophage regulatory protein